MEISDPEIGRIPGPDFKIVIEDDLATATRAAVEVRLELADGSQRWCFFMTPGALAQCGDWVPGTRVPMQLGELHMFIVGECTERIITTVLQAVAERGELLLRTRPFRGPFGTGAEAS